MTSLIVGADTNSCLPSLNSDWEAVDGAEISSDVHKDRANMQNKTLVEKESARERTVDESENREVDSGAIHEQPSQHKEQDTPPRGPDVLLRLSFSESFTFLPFVDF